MRPSMILSTLSLESNRADAVVELGREERDDLGRELERALPEDVREVRRAVLVEVHALLAGRAWPLGELHRLHGLEVLADIEEDALLGITVVAAERRVEAVHAPGAGEVGDHVELVDDLRRALDDHDRLDLLRRRRHEVDPLANAERRDLLDPAEIEHEPVALDALRDLRAVERLVDHAAELQARDGSVGELLDRELGFGRYAGVGLRKPRLRGAGGDFHQVLQKCRDLACVRSSRRFISSSNTAVTSVW